MIRRSDLTSRTWLLPVVVGAVVRLVYWAAVTPGWVPRSDARQYVELARSVAAGHGFSATFPSGVAHATAFRPPLYPALLSIPTRVFGAALWPARLLALVLGLALIVVTVRYVERIAGSRAASAAGLAVAVVPSLVANDTITTTETLGLVLTMGVLLALLRRQALLAGCLCGLLMLTRPNAYLVLVVVVVVVWRGVGWRGVGWHRAGVAVGACAVVVAPWVLRNVVEVGTPKLVTSDGFTLAAMYGPPAQATGGFMDPTVVPWYRHHGFTDLQHDEGEWSDRLTSLAVAEILREPTTVLERAAGGAATMLEVPGYRAVEAEYVDGRDPGFRDATLLAFPLLVIAGGAGLLSRWRDRRTWPAAAIVAGYISLSLVTVSVPRLRGPLDLLLCIGVGYLVGWASDRHEAPSPCPTTSDPTAELGSSRSDHRSETTRVR